MKAKAICQFSQLCRGKSQLAQTIHDLLKLVTFSSPPAKELVLSYKILLWGSFIEVRGIVAGMTVATNDDFPHFKRNCCDIGLASSFSAFLG